MGAESTIADYNTDLGVQIVNIWDETKNQPVTAAWCWLGKDEKGKPALVVDNIEANTLYSHNYPEQLTGQLFDYLKKYARAIGAEKVVLGKANNDLPTGGQLAKMEEGEGSYDKIGGYNREDGYYLEAENKSVKNIWQAKERPTKSAEKEKKIAPVKFEDLRLSGISEEDLSSIRRLEERIYSNDLAQGQEMIEDIKKGKGLEYSVVISGLNPKTKELEMIGYIAAIEDKTDGGDPCIYLEDIAVIPEAQGQGIGWELLSEFIHKLKTKAQKDNKPVFLDLHLRDNSQRFMEKLREDLEKEGVKLIEEALVPDYYDEGEDALYQVYEVSLP
jgi:ribosomal protein S18 acetylase RimI-like enzyme